MNEHQVRMAIGNIEIVLRDHPGDRSLALESIRSLIGHLRRMGYLDEEPAMKRRMTRDKYEALRDRCVEQEMLLLYGTPDAYVKRGVAAVLKELVEVDDPNGITCEKCGERWVRQGWASTRDRNDWVREGQVCRTKGCGHILGSNGWLAVPDGIDSDLQYYLEDLAARVRKLEGQK